MNKAVHFEKVLDAAEDEYLQLFCKVKKTALYKAYTDDALKGMYSHHFAKMTTPYHPILLKEVLAHSKSALNRSFVHVKLPFNSRVDKRTRLICMKKSITVIWICIIFIRLKKLNHVQGS